MRNLRTYEVLDILSENVEVFFSVATQLVKTTLPRQLSQKKASREFHLMRHILRREFKKWEKREQYIQTENLNKMKMLWKAIEDLAEQFDQPISGQSYVPQDLAAGALSTEENQKLHEWPEEGSGLIDEIKAAIILDYTEYFFVRTQLRSPRPSLTRYITVS
eukprot:GHVS01012969.1.p1 GENE.GHVS01012969.1~~GHVS01012969.1.p1  ORF type:complete len:162 (+),score=8.00 GHVS01012969.1:929-1414(+)